MQPTLVLKSGEQEKEKREVLIEEMPLVKIAALVRSAKEKFVDQILRCKKLKGGYVRDFKNFAALAKRAADSLVSYVDINLRICVRHAEDEAAKRGNKLHQLEAEKRILRSEINNLREHFDRRIAPAPTPSHVTAKKPGREVSVQTDVFHGPVITAIKFLLGL